MCSGFFNVSGRDVPSRSQPVHGAAGPAAPHHRFGMSAIVMGSMTSVPGPGQSAVQLRPVKVPNGTITPSRLSTARPNGERLSAVSETVAAMPSASTGAASLRKNDGIRAPVLYRRLWALDVRLWELGIGNRGFPSPVEHFPHFLEQLVPRERL